MDEIIATNWTFNEHKSINFCVLIIHKNSNLLFKNKKKLGRGYGSYEFRPLLIDNTSHRARDGEVKCNINSNRDLHQKGESQKQGCSTLFDVVIIEANYILTCI